MMIMMMMMMMMIIGHRLRKRGMAEVVIVSHFNFGIASHFLETDHTNVSEWHGFSEKGAFNTMKN